MFRVKNALSIFAILSIFLFNLLLIFQTNAQGAPQAAFINVVNNSDVDLQYYGCDGLNEIYLNDINSGTGPNEFNGTYQNSLAKKAQTANLSFQQNFNPTIGAFAPLPTSITLKFALGIPKTPEYISKVCTSTDTTYIKSTTVPVSLSSASEVTISGTGNATVSKKGFINTTYVGFGFDYSQELNQTLQNTTTQLPKINLQSSGPPTSGAKICVNGAPTAVTLDSNNQYTISLPANTAPSLSIIDNAGTGCQATPAPLVLPSLKPDFQYSTNVIPFVPSMVYVVGSTLQLTSSNYVPSQKGVSLAKIEPNVTNPQTNTYTPIAKACIDNVVTNELISDTSFFPVGTGPHTILPVNPTNTCDTTASTHTINTPANTVSYLSLMNTFDRTQPLNIAFANSGPVPTQQPTIQTPVTIPLPANGIMNSQANTVSTSLLLEQNLSGNLSLKEPNAGTSGEDLLVIDLEFTGTTTLPIGTTITYKPITNPADLTSGGQGLPENSTQLSVPFEVVFSPQPTNLGKMNVTFRQPSLKKSLATIDTSKLKAFASNSPFVAYQANVLNNSVTTSINGGFKQLALYEVGTNGGLIRTGGFGGMNGVKVVGIFLVIAVIGYIGYSKVKRK
jgi:hypothetical protein